MKIELLDWDSRFFKRRIGRIESDQIANPSELRSFDVDTIYFVSSVRQSLLEKSGYPLIDEKTTWRQPVKSVEDREIPPMFAPDESSHALEDLFLRSGEYSRFKLDPVFAPFFEGFYLQWLKNALSHQFDDHIFCTGKKGSETGVVTLKEGIDSIAISIISVSPEHQGQGIGKALVKKAMDTAWNSRKANLNVVTQAANKGAMNFYAKTGFSVVKREFIYHIHL